MKVRASACTSGGALSKKECALKRPPFAVVLKPNESMKTFSQTKQVPSGTPRKSLSASVSQLYWQQERRLLGSPAPAPIAGTWRRISYLCHISVDISMAALHPLSTLVAPTGPYCPHAGELQGGCEAIQCCASLPAGIRYCPDGGWRPLREQDP